MRLAKHKIAKLKKYLFSFKRDTMSFKRVTISFKQHSMAFKRLTTSFKRLTISFKRLTISFKRLTTSFKRLTTSFKRPSMLFKRDGFLFFFVSQCRKRGSVLLEARFWFDNIFHQRLCTYLQSYLDEYCVWKKDCKNLFVQHSIDGITSRFSQVVSKLWQI